MEGSAQSDLFVKFCARIKNTLASESLKSTSPWVYWTMEMYSADIKGFGGLGMLAGDTRAAAQALGIPMVFVTALYPEESHQVLNNFTPESAIWSVNYEERGFLKEGTVEIETLDQRSSITHLDVYTKQEGSVTVIGITEANFGRLYQGGNSDWHRMYQDVAVGFGGYKVLKQMNLMPAIHQMNEAPTVFGALAALDDQYGQIKKRIDDEEKILSEDHSLTEEEKEALALGEAIDAVRRKTIYTNHTLIQAVESDFTEAQFDHFVFPNLKNEAIKNWLRQKIEKRGSLKLSVLALALADKKNGVSRLHAQVAGREFRDETGAPVMFEGITNGVFLMRWNEKITKIYTEAGVLDEFGLPASEFGKKLKSLSNDQLNEIATAARVDLRKVLSQRHDQYGNPIIIADEMVNDKKTKIFYWTRRFAGYKRPELMFTDLERFSQILEEENIHMILAGRVHQRDLGMKTVMKSLFEEIDRVEILKKRVHFVQDYDEEAAHALACGGDALLNTPIVGRGADGKIILSTEASGTSPMKARQVIMISREDGFFADPVINAIHEHREYSPSFLRIEGNSTPEELDSLYTQIRRASHIIDGKHYLTHMDFLKRQEIDFLPISTISRMMAKYLHFAFPIGDHEWEESELFSKS